MIHYSAPKVVFTCYTKDIDQDRTIRPLEGVLYAVTFKCAEARKY